MELRTTVKRNANPVTIENILSPVVRKLGLEPVLIINKLKRNWEHIVGPANARNTKPLSIENGILTISVSSPAWITQARFLKSSFIEKITKFDSQFKNCIRDIAFKLY